MTTRRIWLVVAAVALSSCACPEARVSRTAYAETASFGLQISACVVEQSCEPLCRHLFGLSDRARLERCEVTQVDRQASVTPAGAMAAADLQVIRGVQVQVTYVHQDACAFSFGAGGGDGDVEAGWDDGSTDDGSDDMNDGSDDGSDDGMDDGSDDGGDDGDGGGDDGGGDDGGGGDGRAPGGGVHGAHNALSTRAATSSRTATSSRAVTPRAP